jgi:hypothetical protein
LVNYGCCVCCRMQSAENFVHAPTRSIFAPQKILLQRHLIRIYQVPTVVPIAER